MIERDITYPNGGGTNESWDFTYDADDRLITVQKDSSTVAEYRYDPFGRRVLKKAGATTKTFFYDREDILEVRTGATISDKFVHGPGIDDYIGLVRPAGQSEAGTYFYHTDGLGSSSELTTQAGSTIKSEYEYKPFGEASVLQGATLAAINTYQYTGREQDSTIDLMYYRSRYYDPGQGRFVQEDKWGGVIGIPISYNIKYSYVGNNPFNYIDPFGYESSPQQEALNQRFIDSEIPVVFDSKMENYSPTNGKWLYDQKDNTIHTNVDLTAFKEDWWCGEYAKYWHEIGHHRLRGKQPLPDPDTLQKENVERQPGQKYTCRQMCYDLEADNFILNYGFGSIPKKYQSCVKSALEKHRNEMMQGINNFQCDCTKYGVK